MSIWSVKDNHEFVDLYDWCIVEFTFDEDDKSRHAVGYAMGAGRVSSAILKYDTYIRNVTTQSRTYRLAGSPIKLENISGDTSYTLNRWIDLNKVKMMTDVSNIMFA